MFRTFEHHIPNVCGSGIIHILNLLEHRISFSSELELTIFFFLSNFEVAEPQEDFLEESYDTND
jgi:hypothetical protein